MPRNPILQVVTGVKGVGKTYQTIKQIGKYIRANPRTGKTAGKVLIFDINFEYTTKSVLQTGENYTINPIGINDIKRFSIQNFAEARRILPLNEDGTAMSPEEKEGCLGSILRDFRKGLLVVEDMNNYVLDVSHSKDIVGSIINNRHRGQDIIIQLQSLSALNPRLFQNAGVIRFHYQTDDTTRYKNRIPNYEFFSIGEQLVKDRYFNGDIRFFVYIDMNKLKIFGDYDRNEYQEAAKRIMIINKGYITDAMKQYNIGDFNQAVEYLLKKKYNVYYGGR